MFIFSFTLYNRTIILNVERKGIKMKTLERFSQFVSNTFAIWVLIFAALAFLSPNTFSWIGGYITILLGIVMFGMGLTITIDDFKEVLTRPRDVAVGVVGQFVIMPTLAYLLAKGFNLPPEVAVGVILSWMLPCWNFVECHDLFYLRGMLHFR